MVASVKEGPSPLQMEETARVWMQVRSRLGGSSLRVLPPDGLCLVLKVCLGFGHREMEERILPLAQR